MKANPRVRRLIAERIVHDPGNIPAALLAAALSGRGTPGFNGVLDAAMTHDARVRAPAITCPTLVLWGREDRLLPLAMGEELQHLVPYSRLVVWDDVGHCPMLENPARFNELVIGFAHA